MKLLLSKHRAIDPVIANLILIATAVVGGTVVFAFSQDFFNTSQISGNPTLEVVEILGYDARDADALVAHDGALMPVGTGGIEDSTKQADERIAVYVTNHSPQKVTIANILFSGKNYTANVAAATLDTHNGISPAIGEYVILTDGVSATLENSGIVIQAGQTVTIILDLKDSMKIGRDAQFQFKTTRGNLWVSTINIGQNSG